MSFRESPERICTGRMDIRESREGICTGEMRVLESQQGICTGKVCSGDSPEVIWSEEMRSGEFLVRVTIVRLKTEVCMYAMPDNILAANEMYLYLRLGTVQSEGVQNFILISGTNKHFPYGRANYFN